MCTPKFTEALFTIAKIRKQLKCPSTDEWINKIYNGILPSHKKNEILPFTTCMDLESINFSEVRERNTVWYHSSMKF